MNNRERTIAILNYQSYDRLPVIHFGYWHETLEKWAQEGHITVEESKTWGDNNPTDFAIAKKLGFDFGWATRVWTNTNISPTFETITLETRPDGTKLVRNYLGAVELHAPGAGSIPAEVAHTLKDRASWEEEFLPR